LISVLLLLGLLVVYIVSGGTSYKFCITSYEMILRNKQPMNCDAQLTAHMNIF